MKNILKGFLGAVFTVLFTITAWADAGNTQSIDYPTDYYMIVESKEGGINIYAEADLSSQKLNDQLIPNGTALHIEGEKQTDDKRIWGYTKYHGMYGFVPTDDLKPVTRSQAVQSEYYLYGGKDADYDLTVAAKDGSVALYHGPGEKYDTVSGADQIPNGQVLHITAEADAGEDGLWGKTDYEGLEGWVNIHQAKGEDSKGEDADGIEIIETVNPTEKATPTKEPETASAKSSEAAPAKKAQATPTKKPEATPTKEPEATVTEKPEATPTKKPEATPTKKPEATPTKEPEATPTKKPEATPTKEPEATVTEKPEATPTKDPETVTPTEEAVTPTEEAATPTEAAVTPTEEAVTPTEEAVTPTDKASAEKDASAKEASSQEAKAEKGIGNLALWILLAAVVIGLIIVVVLMKKNKKN